MKKAAILTLNGYYNYGNRLQNYAVQEVLKKLDFEVETLIINEEKTNKIIQKKPKGRVLNKISLNYIENKIWQLLNKKNLKRSKERRTEVFREFSNKYITEVDYNITNENSKIKELENIDYCIIGSDQVWNPNLVGKSAMYFAAFVPQEKRVSFSASFGVSEIPKILKENYKKHLSEMANISVREEAGAKIIKNLINKDVEIHLDPTMMLTKDEWLAIGKKTNNMTKEKYILTYFLGKLDLENKNRIEKIAKEKDLKIINLADKRDFETYETGPSEFIEYINNAEVFCTDSFHGVVFSILLEKPFVAFERKDYGVSMFSRIETILKKFNLENRKNTVIKNEDIFNINYLGKDIVLEKERERLNKYLKSSLEVK